MGTSISATCYKRDQTSANIACPLVLTRSEVFLLKKDLAAYQNLSNNPTSHVLAKSPVNSNIQIGPSEISVSATALSFQGSNKMLSGSLHLCELLFNALQSTIEETINYD